MLTPKQELFCREYIVDFNATQAAKRAGYKEKTAFAIGHENLKKPKIQSLLATLMRERMEKANIDAQYVLNRLVSIDQMDIADIFNDDLTFKPLSEWPKAWRQYLSGIDVAEMFEGRGDEREMAGLIKKIKWPDKVRNLEMLGKHVDVRAWDKEKETTTTVNNIMPVPTADSVDDWESTAKANQERLLNK